jgi:hypothetical protein
LERPFETPFDKPLENPLDRPLESPLDSPFEKPFEVVIEACFASRTLAVTLLDFVGAEEGGMAETALLEFRLLINDFFWMGMMSLRWSLIFSFLDCSSSLTHSPIAI